ncbi:MAG: hypothetical protein U9R32_00845 [Bacteroidota bacterium]|nr:hypothetical protein [Bacteroidota bacterium]
MKKLVFIIALLGIFSFGTPKVADAANETPCVHTTITCPDGNTYMAIVCDGGQFEDWVEILCGIDIS